MQFATPTGILYQHASRSELKAELRRITTGLDREAKRRRMDVGYLVWLLKPRQA